MIKDPKSTLVSASPYLSTLHNRMAVGKGGRGRGGMWVSCTAALRDPDGYAEPFFYSLVIWK